MERRSDRCGMPGQGPFDRFHVGGRVWVGWDCMTVEEQRRERMVCERCEAPYYAQDDPDEGIEANTEGWICEVSRPLIYPDCQSLDDRIDFVRRRAEMWAQTTERARQQMDLDMRERIESAVQDEQEEIARLKREIEDLNRSLGPPAMPTGGE
jgi:hypothetical protein